MKILSNLVFFPTPAPIAPQAEDFERRELNRNSNKENSRLLGQEAVWRLFQQRVSPSERY